MSPRKPIPLKGSTTSKNTSRETTVEYDDDYSAEAGMPRPLTFKEKNVLEFLENYMREHGTAPSYQEICQNFGFASYNSVQRYLKQLEEKGYIHNPGGNQKRALTLLRPASAVRSTMEEFSRNYASLNESAQAASVPQNVRNVMPAINPTAGEVLNLPMLGRVAAGAPIEAYEHDEYIDVPASLVRHADRTYALRVQGQSMIEDGIFDGDVILVQRQSAATNGEIVVAMIGEEATVKRFYTHSKEGEKVIELRPANSKMSSLWFNPDEVQIRGVVVGLIRKF
jgi:repressor LexA